MVFSVNAVQLPALAISKSLFNAPESPGIITIELHAHKLDIAKAHNNYNRTCLILLHVLL